MGHSQAEKLKTHDRLVEIAARRFREVGADGLSIADLMAEAGLTQGGFYKHFASRDDLVTQAVARALDNGKKRSGPRSPDETGEPADLAEVVAAYLGKKHRDNIGAGCAVSALMTDARRMNDEARALYTDQVKGDIEALSAMIGSNAGESRPKALLALCAMVGAIGLSRAVSDRALSDEILKSVGASLLRSSGSSLAKNGA
jgi:TetR/AcrR family transcriptional regulator, transcriptional repressor for nem operon